MKFTLSWLKDHLETPAPLEDILYALTDLGLEVEEVVNPLAKLAPFTIAKVLHAEKHPDADKLRVCRVLTDEGEKQIVCGAPNARAGPWFCANRAIMCRASTLPLASVKFAALKATA
jgi:phenylalanyl-tRNA synthetase beta chain